MVLTQPLNLEKETRCCGFVGSNLSGDCQAAEKDCMQEPFAVGKFLGENSRVELGKLRTEPPVDSVPIHHALAGVEADPRCLASLVGSGRLGTRSPVSKHLPNWRRRDRIR